MGGCLGRREKQGVASDATGVTDAVKASDAMKISYALKDGEYYQTSLMLQALWRRWTLSRMVGNVGRYEGVGRYVRQEIVTLLRYDATQAVDVTEALDVMDVSDDTEASDATELHTPLLRYKMYKNGLVSCKADNILTNLNEQNGVALRHQSSSGKCRRHENISPEAQASKKKPAVPRAMRNVSVHTGDHRHGSLVLPNHSKGKLVRKKSNPARTRENGDTSEPYGYKPRHRCYPIDLEALENLEVENTMLKNELNVTNREFNELLNRLTGTEEELHKAKIKLERIESQNIDQENATKQIEKLKMVIDKNNRELVHYREEKQELETEITVLRERIQEFSELIKRYEKLNQERESIRNETENDLQHSQSVINQLQSDLKKTKEECKRLETDWDDYKLWVKTILKEKDKEIKALQHGVNLTEDTKIVVDQLENLKEERELLAKAVTQLREGFGDMKQRFETLEQRYGVAERVAVALRDALREERAASAKARAALEDMEKKMKDDRIEADQQIATLETALRDLQNEMRRLLETPGTSSQATTVATTASHAINVADFDAAHSYHREAEENIEYLTDKLEERQAEIQKLAADNMMLNMQVQNLESKLHAVVLQGNSGHGMESLRAYEDSSQKLRAKLSLTSKLSRWCGMVITSHPVFGIILIMYMVCMNIWVLTVQLTSSLQDGSKACYHYSQPMKPN
ncbi:golgin subfamily A member 5 domain-containing protein [Phthorimaea operculella]|nr:golgin subfamily A member 5 domain-containing protein [Phthorimaea operculella]